MSFTNSTPNYGLPQYIGTDKPTYLGDMNGAYSTIDIQMKNNADAASAAVATANAAASAATTAATNATTAINTANNAASEAASATSAAASATATANTADANAASALRASAGNSIENLAPAYDPTLTYDVNDLVTYIDENNSGKVYKCIVPVSTPEAFNINKWDDVTTSEVYERKHNLIKQVTADGVKTLKQLLDSLGSGLVFNKEERYELHIQYDDDVNDHLTAIMISPVDIKFTYYKTTAVNQLEIDAYYLANNNTSKARTYTFNSSGNLSYATIDTNVPNNNTIFELFS